jgi:hypothetical protein
VRSVQRFDLPPGRDARWVASEYIRWLPTFVWPFLHCQTEPHGVVRFRSFGVALLELSLAHSHCSDDRQIFFITGGVLAATEHNARGRFEFREVLGRTAVIAAIHDFTPRLPWYFYNWTQAVAHLWVMRGFQRHLRRLTLETRRNHEGHGLQRAQEG